MSELSIEALREFERRATRIPQDLPLTVHEFSEDEWLAMHDDGEILTASQIAAAVGADINTSQFALHHYKRGAERESLNDLRMLVAHRLESLIAFVFAKREGLDVFNLGDYASIQHPDYTWLWATLDFATLEYGIDGIARHVIPIELKHMAAFSTASGQFLAGDAPLGYDIQVQMQMACTGAPFAYLVCLIGEGWKDIQIVRVERNDELIGLLIREARRFLDDVRDGNAPDPTGSANDTAILGRLMTGGFRVDLGDELTPLMEERETCGRWLKAIQGRSDEIKNIVLARATEAANATDQTAFEKATARYIQIGARWLKWGFHPGVRVEAYDKQPYWDTRTVKGPK